MILHKLSRCCSSVLKYLFLDGSKINNSSRNIFFVVQKKLVALYTVRVSTFASLNPGNVIVNHQSDN